ncbi:MAG TPA: host attachment protein [Thermodesulfobacteriota bacterium]|nr:host attachment protein [Thermodesulfobacteriota bacterium]
MALEDRIDDLLEFESDRYPVTSLYLKLGPEERKNFQYKITLKNLIKEQKDKLGEKDYTSESIQSVETDLEKLTDYFENPDNLTACRGIAVFSSTGERLWEVFKLPYVYRDRLTVNSSPLVRQLITINNEFGNVVIVAIDRKKARLFNINLDGTEEIMDYFYPEATRSTRFKTQEGGFKQKVSPTTGGGEVPHGFGEYRFQRMIENEIHQHFKYVAEKLFDYYKENKFDRLIIGGFEQVLEEFSNHLHTYLKQKSLGTVHIDTNTVRPDELIEKTLDFLEAEGYKKEKSLIKEFEEKLPLGLAVSNLTSTLKSLMMGQVRILLVSEGFRHSGYRCPDSGILVLEGREDICPEGKTPLPVADVVDDAIEEALGQSAEVAIIHDEETKKKIDGIAAILRFKL